MFSAGEVSGDQHAAKVIARLKRDKNFACFGMGAGQMRQAGMELLVDSTAIAVMGIVNIIRHYRQIRRALKIMKNALRERRPDLLVIVDYPEFNLRLAAVAQSLGIGVLIYIAPQVWAWRPGRIKKIIRLADKIAVILPFEEALYNSRDNIASFVGHPLSEDIAACPWAEEERIFPEHKATVLLLPGSRKTEIDYLMPVICEAAERMQRQSPKRITFRLLKADGIDEARLQSQLRNTGFDCEIVAGNTYAQMRAADLAIAACGTAVMQLALCQTPAVVIYKISKINYLIAKQLTNISLFCLPNIIAGRAIIPELIQADATPEKICAASIGLLSNRTHYRETVKQLATMRRHLGDKVASENVAGMIAEMTADIRSR